MIPFRRVMVARSKLQAIQARRHVKVEYPCNGRSGRLSGRRIAPGGLSRDHRKRDHRKGVPE